MSVEQKIREVLNDSRAWSRFMDEDPVLEEGFVVESILQIIESDVIGEDEELGADGLTRSEGGTVNNLRAEQRANLREEKS